MMIEERATYGFTSSSLLYRPDTSLPRRPRLDLLGQQLLRQVLSVA